MNQSFYRNMALWDVLLVMMILLVSVLRQNQSGPEEIIYSQLHVLIESDQVQSLELEEGQITGVLKEMKIINPHSVFVIEVTEPNGQKTDWTGVTASGAAMFRAGWTSETLKVGTKVTVEGNPPRKETAKGILITSFTLPDGRKITPAKID